MRFLLVIGLVFLSAGTAGARTYERPSGANRIDARMTHCLVAAGARGRHGIPLAQVDTYDGISTGWAYFPHPYRANEWAEVDWTVMTVNLDEPQTAILLLLDSHLHRWERRAANRCADWALA